MMVKPYYPLEKIIHSIGIGVDVKEETLATDTDNLVVSHKYENQFHSLEDVDRLHM